MTTNTPPQNSAEAAFERRLAAVTRAVGDYHPYLLSYLHGLTRQWQDAENLLQDLWRHVLLRFDEDKIHSLPLLRSKAYQLFIDYYRRQKRRGEILTDELPETPAPPRFFVSEGKAGEAALRARFWSEYPGLDVTEDQKEALWLHARYGFTFREIAARLDVPTSTIGDWVALYRKKLSEAINHQKTK
jgi:RNA polymerase sigma factor (sigma-70 family)